MEAGHKENWACCRPGARSGLEGLQVVPGVLVSGLGAGCCLSLHIEGVCGRLEFGWS